MAYRKTPKIKAHLKAQRETIVAAATAVVAKHGRDKFLVRTVERSGVSMGTVYQYFADVDELWNAVVAAALARDVAAIRDSDKYPPPSTPINALARGLAVFYSTFDKPRLARALAEVPAYRKGIRSVLEPLIGAALDLPPRAREQYAATILGALYGLSDIGATSKAACEFALRALGVPSAAARAIV